MDAKQRLAELEYLQTHYASFLTFLKDMMAFLGFVPSWMQYDIGAFLQYGPANLMVQAQRGEAKSTITCIFAVWMLIHDPTHRIVIVSAGENKASQNATLIQRLIFNHPALACLRPDRSKGDRTSVEAFDVHHALRKVDAAPSVACFGIFGTFTGSRADLLIADDIESPKNSRTAVMREQLVTLSNEFTAVATGKAGFPPRILYLGTPQNNDSIYNGLSSRGWAIRIWPGRYPTPAQMDNYGEYLAPSLANRLEADPTLGTGGGAMGDQGKPTDPAMFCEAKLSDKELNGGGPAYFQLNYMLSTALVDKARFPLRTENLIVCDVGTRMPLRVTRGFSANTLRDVTVAGHTRRLQTVYESSPEIGEFSGTHMRVDPAGGAGDESSYAVTAELNGYVYLLSVGGVNGGYGHEQLDALAIIAEKWKPNVISVEKNLGYGAFTRIWLPVLRKRLPTAAIDEPFETTNKTDRMLGVLEPLTQRGLLVISAAALEEDDQTCARYGPEERRLRSLLFQYDKITRVKKALRFDDRLDAVAGSVGHWVNLLAKDQQEEIERQNAVDAYNELVNHPALCRQPSRGTPVGGMLAKYQTRR